MQLIRIITFTDRGYELAERISEAMPDHVVQIRDRDQDADAWIRESFDLRIPILFISACGIAVRLIAPYVKDKYTDSAVIVADEAGRYVIPILSGHLGRANRLADVISRAIGAECVLTTATDVNSLIAIDVLADINGLAITDRDGVKRISSKLLKEGRLTIAIQDGIGYDAENVPDEISIVPYVSGPALEDREPGVIADVIISDDMSMTRYATLHLRPVNYVLGIGCKKGTSAVDIDAVVRSCIEDSGLTIAQCDIAAVSSIDLKAAERGLLRFAATAGIPFITYSADELNGVEGDFSASEFVKEVTGVDNVCERAAILCAWTLGSSATLTVRKYAHDGVSVAIARMDKRMIKWD